MPEIAATEESGAPGKESIQGLFATLFAIGMIVGFAFPWLPLDEQRSLSGWQLGSLGWYGQWCWLVPILALITIALGVLKKDQSLAGMIAGFSPIAGFGIISAISPDSLMHSISYGAYITLGCAFAMLVSLGLAAGRINAPWESAE